MKLHLNSLTAALVAVAFTIYSVQAQELRFPAAPAAIKPGAALATDGVRYLVGDPGAVHVHTAGTGVHQRTLNSPDSSNREHFGTAVALSGNLALIGAPRTQPIVNRVPIQVQGAAYVMDVASGALVFRLSPSQAFLSRHTFGTSVGVCGNLALVGSPAENGGRGAVYAYDLQQRGQLVRRIVLPNAAVGDRFGSSLSTAGSLALIGAPGKVMGSGATRKGAAYVVDVNTGAVVQTMESRSLNDIGRPALVPGVTASSFGTSVTMAGDLAVVEETQEINGRPVQALVHVHRLSSGRKLVKMAADGPRASMAVSGSLLAVGGAEVGTAGAVAFYHAHTSARLADFTTSDAQAGDGFGRALVFQGSTLLASTSATGARAAVYQLTDLAGPMPGRVVTHQGAQAPSIANATLDGFNHFHINAEGETQFRCSLAGAGIFNSNNRALYNELRPKPLSAAARAQTPVLSLVLQKGETLDGFTVTSLDDNTTFQNPTTGIVAATLTPTTAPFTPRQVLMTDNSTALNIFKRQGDAASRNPGLNISSFESVSASSRFQWLAVNVRKNTQVASINSAVLLINPQTGRIEAETHENGALPTSLGRGTMGEATGRPVVAGARVIFTAPFTMGNNNFANRGLFKLTQAEGLQTIATDSMTATGLNGASLRTFDNVSATDTGTVAFRSTLSGDATRNECIVVASGNTRRMAARKGDAVPAMTGSTFGSFEQLWITDGGAVIFLAEVNNSQPGPRTSRVLCLARPNGTLEVLLRQGELAPGTTNGERIARIEALEGNTGTGAYAVIATLADSGQRALLTGNAARAQAKPVMLLRQGTLVSFNGQSTPVSSMRMTVTNPVACGGGSAISGSQVALLVTLFDTVEHACVLDLN